MLSRRGFRNALFTLSATAISIVWSLAPTYACGLCDNPQHLVAGHIESPNATDAPTSGNLGSFNIVLNPNANLASNAAALAAFERAAANWEAYISDPITVTINASFDSLGAGILGSTNPLVLSSTYDSVRNQMVADAADEGTNDTVVNFLPTSAQFTALLPTGYALTSSLLANKANFKALGYTGLDQQFGAADGTISFSSNFSFDFDNTDNLNTNLVDFETVATHEIGHLLGFISSVDTVDTTSSGAISPFVLDLFRFSSDVAGSDPSTLPQFTGNARSLLTGVDSITDDVDSEFRMSTGRNKGDGRQASHWKDGDLTGSIIGVMDPTLGPGQVIEISAADLRAFDVIGYDIAYQPVPAPPAAVSLGIGAMVGLLGFGSRKFRAHSRRNKRRN